MLFNGRNVQKYANAAWRCTMVSIGSAVKRLKNPAVRCKYWQTSTISLEKKVHREKKILSDNSGKILTVSRELAKILTVGRKSRHSIETLVYDHFQRKKLYPVDSYWKHYFEIVKNLNEWCVQYWACTRM